MLSFPTTITNNPARKGEFAAQPQLFGAASRYKVAPIHTRFDAVEWFVWDAERPGRDGKPEVVRQCATLAEAVDGLDTEAEECYTSSAQEHVRLLRGI